jgi:hypothetical protein
MSDIRNFRTAGEKKRKEDDFFRTLRLQSKLAQQANEAVSDKMESQQLNVTPVAPKKRPIEEELNDYQAQRQMAFENLMSLRRQGVTATIAEDIVNNMGDATGYRPETSDLVLLNNQWTKLNEFLKNQRTITKDSFEKIFKRYKESYGETGIQNLKEEIASEVVRKIEPQSVDVLPDPNAILNTQNIVEADGANYLPDLDNPPAAVAADVADPNLIINDPDPVIQDRARRIYNYCKRLGKTKMVKIAKENIPVDSIPAVFGNNGAAGAARRVWEKMPISGGGVDESRRRALIFVDHFIKGILWGQQARPAAAADNKMYYLKGPTEGFGLPQPESQPKLHRKGHATIMLPREGNRRIVGRGIPANPKPRYAEFGKLVIHVPSLNKGILNLKYKSHSNVQGLPQQNISSDMVDFLLDVIEKGQVNQSLFNKLSREDQRLFVKIGGSAQIDDGLGYRSIHDEEEKKEMDRFNLVRGIFLAGNNSKEVIQELQGFLRKFLHDGRISKSEGLSLLQEISVLV